MVDCKELIKEYCEENGIENENNEAEWFYRYRFIEFMSAERIPICSAVRPSVGNEGMGASFETPKR
jgi:hypothetical protein